MQALLHVVNASGHGVKVQRDALFGHGLLRGVIKIFNESRFMKQAANRHAVVGWMVFAGNLVDVAAWPKTAQLICGLAFGYTVTNDYDFLDTCGFGVINRVLGSFRFGQDVDLFRGRSLRFRKRFCKRTLGERFLQGQGGEALQVHRQTAG